MHKKNSQQIKKINVNYVHDHPWKFQLFPVDHNLVVRTNETAPVIQELKLRPLQTSLTHCADWNAWKTQISLQKKK